MSRIAIVGVEGSGKTVLMAALADMFGKPSEDALYLMPENQASFSFMTQIPHKMKEEHQWPSATAIESMKHLKWTVRMGKQILSEIEMLDYPGELYRIAFGDRKEEEIAPYREQVHEFLGHLVEADTLIVLLNLKDAMDIGANAKNTETVWLTRSIFDYAKKMPNIKKQMLLFSQADRYPEQLTGEGGLVAAKEKYMPMLHVLHPDLECAAVAVATDDSDTPAKAFSASHGVTELMRWVILQTEEGKKANAIMQQCSELIKKENPTGNLTNRIEALREELKSIIPRVSEIIRPNGLEELQHKLNELHEQAVTALRKENEKAALAAQRAKWRTDVNKCEQDLTMFETAETTAALSRMLETYKIHLAALNAANNGTLNEDDRRILNNHHAYYAQFNAFEEFVKKFTQGKKGKDLAKKQTWAPVKHKYPDPLFAKIIERIRALYEVERKDLVHGMTMLAAFICVLIVALLLAGWRNHRSEKKKEQAEQAELAKAQVEETQHARDKALAAEQAVANSGIKDDYPEEYQAAMQLMVKASTLYGKDKVTESFKTWELAEKSFQALGKKAADESRYQDAKAAFEEALEKCELTEKELNSYGGDTWGKVKLLISEGQRTESDPEDRIKAYQQAAKLLPAAISAVDP